MIYSPDREEQCSRPTEPPETPRENSITYTIEFVGFSLPFAAGTYRRHDSLRWLGTGSTHPLQSKTFSSFVARFAYGPIQESLVCSNMRRGS